MKDNKGNISLAGLFLGLAIVVIIAMSYFMVNLLNEQKTQNEKVAELTAQLSQAQGKNEKMQEKIDGVKDVLREDEENEDEKNLEIINKIWEIPEPHGKLEEFSNIKEASQEFLAAYAIGGLELDEKYNYTDKLTYKDFNGKLVELFGGNANNLLLESSLSKKLIDKNNDNTYSFIGHGGDEYSGHRYIIDKVEKKGNTINVRAFEYETYSEAVDLGENEECIEYIYDMKKNTITKNTVKAVEEKKNIISYHIYNENGEDVTDKEKVDNYLLENYKNKLSIRNFELQYNDETDSYILLSNRLEK